MSRMSKQLPKQWKHWCRSAGLKVSRDGRRMVGKGFIMTAGRGWIECFYGDRSRGLRATGSATEKIPKCMSGFRAMLARVVPLAKSREPIPTRTDTFYYEDWQEPYFHAREVRKNRPVNMAKFGPTVEKSAHRENAFREAMA